METATSPSMRGLSGFQLKLIAIAAMLIDHIAWACVDFFSPLGQIMHIIGRLTIPIMCFFIAEGIKHTRNIRVYIFRIVLFGAISAIPFYMFFGDMYGYRQNIMFDLCSGLLTILVLKSESFGKAEKIINTVLLAALSLAVGGWPLVPMAFVVIFYFVTDFKKRCKYVSLTVLILVAVTIVMSLVNDKLHFMGSGWVWYEKLYLLGFVLALPLLKFYNGKRGGFKHSGLIFYIFYPLHLLVLALLFVPQTITVYQIYVFTNVLSLITLITLTVISALSKPSKPLSSIVLLMAFAAMFNVGFILEILSDNLECVIVCIKVEYFAMCCCIIAYSKFIDDFCHLKLPKTVYYIEFLLAAITVGVVSTLEYHSFFYTNLEMDYYGLFPKVDVSAGIGYVIYYALFSVVFIGGVIVCGIRYRRSVGIEKKRMRMIFLGSLCVWIEIIAKILGITGGYDLICLGLLSTAAFFTVALIKYGFFNSIQAANDNAMNYAMEGILVTDTKGVVMFYNNKMSEIYPTIRENAGISDIGIKVSLTNNTNTTISEIGNRIFELRADPISEDGYVQGHMIWAIEMTEHYRNMELIKSKAETDALTGLSNRSHFEFRLTKYLSERRKGVMVMFDMDNFKFVNDHYGHGAGDKVLILFADIIKKMTRSDDLKCRIGGDEFCGFITDTTDKKVLSELAQRVIKGFAAGLAEKNLPTVTTVSIGFAVYDGNKGETFTSLYAKADRALYYSKNHDKNTYSFYDEMNVDDR